MVRVAARKHTFADVHACSGVAEYKRMLEVPGDGEGGDLL